MNITELKLDPSRLANYSLIPKDTAKDYSNTHKQRKKDIRVQSKMEKQIESSEKSDIMSWLVSESLLREVTKKNYLVKLRARNISFDELLENLIDQKAWSRFQFWNLEKEESLEFPFPDYHLEHIKTLISQQHPLSKNFKRHFFYLDESTVESFDSHLQVLDQEYAIKYTLLPDPASNATTGNPKDAKKSPDPQVHLSGKQSAGVAGGAQVLLQLPKAKNRRVNSSKNTHAKHPADTSDPFYTSSDSEPED
jgi:hypothetical protein